MKKHLLKHSLHYFLTAVVFLGVIAALFTIKDPTFRVSAIFLLSVFYLISGIVHHFEEKNLQPSVLAEYLAISAIIFLVLFSVFK